MNNNPYILTVDDKNALMDALKVLAKMRNSTRVRDIMQETLMDTQKWIHKEMLRDIKRTESYILSRGY